MKSRTIDPCLEKKQVHTALLLAAGTGSRLSPLTDITPKCLVTVNEISILERLVFALRLQNFKRLVIVVGHQGDCIRNFLGTRAGGMEITYITSPLYRTTNNIYSLWLARKAIDEPFLLIESDLVFDPEMLKKMLYPDRIAVSRLLPWMNGTTVTINSRQKIEAFHDDTHKHEDNHYKTVNIYSLSSSTWQLVREKLDHYISNNMVNGYYETVFADMVTEGCLAFTPVFFDSNRWYEIDTIADMRAAAQMCGRHHNLPAITADPDHAVSSHLVQGYPQVYRRLKGINRSKMGSRRYPDRKVSVPIISASHLLQ
ncbi:MAG TPA: phosphocholine cytidylyltransferase family protein [Desulfobacterales bacterium]|nr:phosphocholine cytidylyltransferase family protein [Desulfobacterales bacterium]